MDRRIIALVFAALAAGTVLGFFALTMKCGAMEVEANRPDEPRNQPYCVSAPYWPALVFTGLAVGAAYMVWQWWTWQVVTLGVLMLAGGTILVFSFGFWGIGSGLLVVLAGLLGVRHGGERREPSRRELAAEP